MRLIDGPETMLVAVIRRALGKNAQRVAFAAEKPENPAHGDYATNVAMKMAPVLRQPPMEIAEEVVGKLHADSQVGRLAERIEVAPPGFINFFLSPSWLQSRVAAIAVDETYDLRPTAYGKREKVQVEFISANPTGPLTLANGRGGFLGDALANVLEAAGHKVTREYYVNDAGEQVRKIGASVLKARRYAVPYGDEELYQGAYIRNLAEQLEIPDGRGREATAKLVDNIARDASRIMLGEIKKTVRKAGIAFDSWFSEKSLYRQGRVDEILKALKRKRLVEEREGALWLKLSALPEPRVVVKASGEPTYVLPDLAYHEEKFHRRRFNRVIDILGADHHGHAKVLSAALGALGLPAPDVILMQLVRLVENGKEVKMSKRTGTFVTLEELFDEVGQDVARWFFLERAPETHMEFDLSLAKERSEKNPVFYVQYAHTRCAGILRKASEQESEIARKRISSRSPRSLARLVHPSELALAKELVRLPDLIGKIAQTYEVHHLTTYATAVATAFSAFYRDCPVLVDDVALREARLTIVRATQVVLASTLRLMGIRAPEKM